LEPRRYRDFALPWEKRLAEEAHRLGLPYALHICGRTDRILDDMLATGADALELDYKTDARLAHDRMRDRAVFIGNLDPSGVLALGTPAFVEEKTRELVATFADTPRFILNAGCAIPATTRGENLRAMIRRAAVGEAFRPYAQVPSVQTFGYLHCWEGEVHAGRTSRACTATFEQVLDASAGVGTRSDVTTGARSAAPSATRRIASRRVGLAVSGEGSAGASSMSLASASFSIASRTTASSTPE
jgi:hypothetical protein